MTINSRPFGKTPDGHDATLWTLENSHQHSLALSDWGASIVAVRQPDRTGRVADVVLGFTDASQYRSAAGYLGATCGRCANRIAGARFTLDGKTYELTPNEGDQHLHGGKRGFDARVWNAEPYEGENGVGVVFHTHSPDGDEGYPGNLEVHACYALHEDGCITMDFRAETDAPTVVNITNHAYWNPAGVGVPSIRDVELRLHSSLYLPVDERAIPLGRLEGVAGSPFDFRRFKTIGAELDGVPGGYDHCMVVDGSPGTLRIAAEARDGVSGRGLTLYTDQPGVQFYSGNYLGSKPFPKHSGFCLEPQGFPDAPHHAHFPSTVIRPGTVYHHRSKVKLDTK